MSISRAPANCSCRRRVPRLDQARISARDVDVVVTVSSTGIATPSIEARVGPEMGFWPTVMRVPVFGRGCAGGVSGLTLGARLARAEPCEVVLVVVIELCTLACRIDRGSKADVISSALFGDGAAAAVLRAGPPAADLKVGAAAEHTWPRTLDIMGWMIDPVGFRVMLSRSLPRFVEQKMAAPVRRFIKSAKLQAPRLICHPGGAKFSTRSRWHWICRRALCVTSAECCATTATCRRRRCCSFSSECCGADCAARPCCRRSGPDLPRTCSRSRVRMGEGAWLVAFLLVTKARRTCFRAIQHRAFARQGCRRVRRRALPTHDPAARFVAHRAVGVGARPAHRLVVVCAFRSMLQFGRLWVIASLGRRWTTRVIVLRGAAPVTTRSLSVDQASELPDCRAGNRRGSAGARAAVFALIFSIANAALVAYRIRIENEALAWAAQTA